MTKIKICGLSRRCDIGFVNRCGPDYAGFVVNVPKSRRSVTPEEARALSALLSPDIIPVGVFVNERAEVVASMLNDGIIFAAQLHGSEDEDYIGDLRRRTGGILIQAFSVASPSDMERAAASPADYVLLDSGGGTGRTFDWRLIKGFKRPYFLAGGLGADNLPAALAELRPFAVDMSSGVETGGVKDPAKIEAAVAAVRRYS
ncbi:phosphoribosylanthranilate isomerase [Cloacibacillus evryensis]